MLTVAAAVAGALPRAAAFAPAAPLGTLRARLPARSAAPARGRAPRALGVRMVATEPAKTDAPQPSPDFKFNMEDITSVCKRRGFIFPSSEIYQGSRMFPGGRRPNREAQGERGGEERERERESPYSQQGPAPAAAAARPRTASASALAHRTHTSATLPCARASAPGALRRESPHGIQSPHASVC